MMNKEIVEQVRDAHTFNEMRAEIYRLRWFDPVTRQVMDMADFQGLNAEDRYTLLSYNALKAKCAVQKQLFDYALTTVQPMII